MFSKLTHKQIIPSSYSNVAKRIKIPDLPKNLRPHSPTDLAIPAPTISISMSNGSNGVESIPETSELPSLSSSAVSTGSSTPNGPSGVTSPVPGDLTPESQPLPLRSVPINPSPDD